MSNDLTNNKTDLLVSATKSILGAIPIAGSLLSELVSNIIPNQRIDRLTKYAQELDSRLALIPVEKINSLLQNEDFIDLVEEGFAQASRAISTERREYIASIVTNGINDETIQLQESKYLLKILQELNDSEIIWLRFYLNPTLSGDAEFREKHKNILKPVRAYMSADNETLTKAALQKSYKEHLERLELVQHNFRVDSSTKLPEFDNSGRPKVSHTSITTLGKLLLENIGLIENN